ALGAERSARDDNDSVWSQSLCHGSGVSERRCALRSRNAGARRWFPALGRVFAIPNSRNGRSYGDRQILAERVGSVWRNFGIAYRGAGRIWSVIVSLPARCAWETKGFFHRSRILPDHVRAYGAFRGVRRIF